MGVHSVKLKIGDSAPDFTLPGIDEKLWSLSDFKKSEIVVMAFLCNHCPQAKTLRKRIVALQKEYRPEKVRIVAFSSNDYEKFPENSLEMMQYVANELDYNFPYLLDDFQEAARAYGVTQVPDFFLFDKSRKLVYHGRLDDNWRDSKEVTARDLKEAIELTLKGKTVAFKHIPAEGCEISWVK
jgi:peroxiredoxin